jgi:hypothetical protein
MTAPVIEATVNLTNQGAAIASTNWFTPVSAGLYQISAYCVVSTAGTGGLMAINGGWNDGQRAQGFTFAALSSLTAKGAYAGVLTLAYCDGVNPVTYEVDVNSLSGSPKWDIHMSATRLSP